jgi:hypothetical protein
MTMVISGSDGVTFPDSTNQFSGGAFSFKNRLINGDMRISQAAGGAAVTVSSLFPVDRFSVGNTSDGAFSAQQDSSAPVGFVNSVKITTTTADATLTTTQALSFVQRIEGTNMDDLGWGTANAKTITLSFWVRSSLTGTFGGSLRNAAGDRSYPFTYTISVADTWEQKSVTIVGETTGTWLTTTGIGVSVFFGLGVGPDRSGTAGAWNSNNNLSATGAVSVIGTLNATWYITGVQLEVGSVATPFERRPFGTELVLCQRYCLRVGDGLTGIASGTSGIYLCPFFANPMRASPTTTLWDTSVKISDNFANDYTSSGSTIGESSLSAFGGRININGFAGALTTGRVYQAYQNTDGYVFVISAEL